MSMSTNLHDPIRAEAWDMGSCATLRLTNVDNCSVTVFMPFAKAQAMADVFNGVDHITALEGFVADFAAADFPAIRAAGMYHPEDEPDDVTELAPIEAWQEDARALIAPQPAMQEAAE